MLGKSLWYWFLLSVSFHPTLTFPSSHLLRLRLGTVTTGDFRVVTYDAPTFVMILATLLTVRYPCISRMDDILRTTTHFPSLCTQNGKRFQKLPG